MSEQTHSTAANGGHPEPFHPEMEIARVEGEPRILDVDLATRLGFAKPAKIRELIKRHAVSLAHMGPLPTVGRVINGGRAVESYLNRKQAIFITAKSDTPQATDITIEIIQRFDAYERAQASKPAAPQAEALEDRPWQARPLEERNTELRTAHAIGRYGNHALAWWYMEKKLQIANFPRRLLPAWRQSEMDVQEAQRPAGVTITVPFAGTGGPH